MDYAIAVINIEMTNKKVAIYDDRLQQLDVSCKKFPPLSKAEPESGKQLRIHDLAGMEKWFIEQLSLFSKKYPIKAITITTHASTFVCIDNFGEACAPCIFYTNEPGEEFQKNFYNRFGAKTQLQKATHTPPFGYMITPAKGIMYLQQKFPSNFDQATSILFYPQYWGYLFTGVTGIEPTYCGSHTYLWDYKKSDWSSIADQLEIRRLLPTNYKNTHEILGTISDELAYKTGLDTSVIVTMGIHDSNATLLPYLAKNKDTDFILNSTGTWCVCMHPQRTLELNKEDIGKIVFFNQTILRKPIKTASFAGGIELITYITLYKKINNTTEFPTFSFDTVNIVLKEKNTFLMPEIVPSSGQFIGCKAGIWEKGKFYSLENMQNGTAIPNIMTREQRFLSMLDLSLVIQTEIALTHAGLQRDTKVITEGGFRKNNLYNTLLAAILPHNSVYRTNLAETTTLGAAMTATMALTGKTLDQLSDSLTFTETLVDPAPIKGYSDYKRTWLELANK